MVHENVETSTVEYESELSETDDLETFAEERSSQNGQHDSDSFRSQLWFLSRYFHMQRVRILELFLGYSRVLDSHSGGRRALSLNAKISRAAEA
jgi:hypothetical protein